MMGKLVRASLLGVGIGQVIYLCFLYLIGAEVRNLSQMVVVSLCSACMGLSSIVYALNWGMRYRQVLHLSLIFLWVSLMMWLNGWFSEVNFLGFFIEFLGIYLLVSFAIFQYEKKKLEKINQKLSELRK